MRRRRLLLKLAARRCLASDWNPANQEDSVTCVFGKFEVNCCEEEELHQCAGDCATVNTW